jgi:retron-type reverse transcriptase
MKIEPSKITEIREKFAAMDSRSDLLALLNLVKPLIFGEKCHQFELKQLTWYASPKLGAKRYQQFAIRKKSGSVRRIHAPVQGLKAIQAVLSLILQSVHESHPAAMGFTMGRSIADNATLHVGKRYVYNMDLKDFFPSIEQARVWNCLNLPPFNLRNSNSLADTMSDDVKILDTKIISGYRLKSNDHGPISIISIITGKSFSRVNRSFKTDKGSIIYYGLKKSEKDGEYLLEIDLQRSNFEEVKERVSKDSKENIENLDVAVIISMLRLSLDNAVNLSGKENRGALANLIASLCCTEMDVERFNKESGDLELVKRNVLPQGAPTSPVITNIICGRLDRRLSGVAKRFGLTYSRYADDITFSSMHNVYQSDGEVIKEVRRIIQEQKFDIKDSKTRLQKDGYRKDVTGLLVNEKVNVQKRYIKRLRMWMHYWETYGYERAHEIFIRDYIRDGKMKNESPPSMFNVISGKLEYLKMIKGGNDGVYSSLNERFEKLIELPKMETSRDSHLEKVLDLIVNEGIDSAMKFFKPKKQKT